VRAVSIIAFALFALAIVGCSDPVEGKYGEDLFRATCAHCHSADLGGGIGPALGPGSSAHLELNDEQIGSVIIVGPGAMPSYGSRLDAGQIASVIAYLRAEQESER
jgi:mono/diheme cytochrome c family protein